MRANFIFRERSRILANTAGLICAILSASVFAAAGSSIEFVASPGGGFDATSQALIIPTYKNVSLTIDGRLDEAIWREIPGYDNMSVVQPDVLTSTSHITKTKLFYTDEGLYVGIEADQPAESLIPRLSSRDKKVNRDGTSFYLDTSGQGLYGFFFGVNLGGSLTDGTFLPERQLNSLWDGPWYGAAAETRTGYTTEMFLPWAMMSMPGGFDVRKMAFAVSRRVAYLDEEWQWPALPASKPKFMSGLQPFQLQDVEPRQQLDFYPFTAATRDRIDGKSSYRVGADIFWRPSTNLQFTATLNPDFGAVESDDVVVNLTAFETFFPEKRLFFLEGTEVFVTSPRSEIRASQSSTGARAVSNSFFLPPTTLVNTRRIGGAARTPVIPAGTSIPDVDLGKPTELAGAAKMTGQYGALRYGVLAAFEEGSFFHGTDNGLPTRLKQEGRDFGVVRFLYEAGGKGRRALGWISTLTRHAEDDAITHGVDWHYRSASSRLIWDGQLIYSEVENERGSGGFFDMNYIPRQGRLHRFSFDYLDDKLDINDLGFIRRNDVITYRYSYSRTNSKHPRFRQRNDFITFSHETNTSGRTVRSSVFYRNTLTFHNRHQLNSTIIVRPAQWDDRKSEGNGDYRTHAGGIVEFSYGTDTSRTVSASIAGSVMSEQLGDLTFIAKGGVTYRPNDRISLDVDFIYRRTDNWIIHQGGRTLAGYDAKHWQPSIAFDLFLTAKQQLRFSLQWIGIQANAQDLYQVPSNDGELIKLTDGIAAPTYDFTISRLTTQLRYRWEIAPLSDLFVVYTRGSNLPSRQDDAFGDLFTDAFTNPVIDTFVVKLRYRISP